MRSGRGSHCNCSTHNEKSASAGLWEMATGGSCCKETSAGTGELQGEAGGNRQGQSASQSEPSTWVFLGLGSRELEVSFLVLTSEYSRDSKTDRNESVGDDRKYEVRQEWKRS